MDVDFGGEYAPHELVARALDARGEEIARARQWINLPRPPAEVEILLEKNALGKAVAARLTWASRMGSKPERVTVTFDGEELPFDITHRVELPAYDASIGHVLTARLEFSNNIHSRSDLVLGGGSTGEAGSELTAVPVRSLSKKPPPVESLAGRLRKDGSSLNVTAVEHGPASIVLVRGTDVEVEAYRRLRGLAGLRLSGDGTEIEKDDLLQVQWPVTREVLDGEGSTVLFEASRSFPGKDASFGFLLTRVGYPGTNLSPRRFADAVAVGALQAVASCSRRAVVLVLGSSDQDLSRSSPASVRRFLELLRVPLYVWSLAEERPPGVVPAAAWGAFDDISSVQGFRDAVDRVRRDLKSQSIVWVEGRHLPQEITLSNDAAGLELVR